MNRSALRTSIRQSCDMVNSTFISDAEINRMIDLSTQALYDLLVRSYGAEYWSQVCWFNTSHPASVNELVQWPNLAVRLDSLGSQGALVLTTLATPVDGRVSAFVLPEQIMMLLRVSWCSGTVSQTLATIDGVLAETHHWLVNTTDETMSPMERIDTTGEAIQLKPKSWRACQPRYRLRRGPVRFISGTIAVAFERILDRPILDVTPVPEQSYAIQLHYVPAARLLTEDAVDFHYPFIDYVISDCAAQCLEKQQSDSSVQRSLQAKIEQRIVSESQPRDAGNPPMVSMHGPYHPQVRGYRGTPWLR